jgi:hypothetical protein
MFMGYASTRMQPGPKSTMDKKPNQPSRKRRAILQGSLAAPVVLTVSSAGAQALTSAGARLARMKDYQPAKSLYFQDSPDNWFRRSVPVVKLKYKSKDSGGTSKSVVKDEDWFYLDPDRGQYIRLSSMQWMSFGGVLPPEWEYTKETSTRHLLVWVDPKTGAESLKMQVEPKGDQIAATVSAMGSFTRAAG